MCTVNKIEKGILSSIIRIDALDRYLLLRHISTLCTHVRKKNKVRTMLPNSFYFMTLRVLHVQCFQERIVPLGYNKKAG